MIPEYGIEEASDLRYPRRDVDADDRTKHVVDRAPRLSSLYKHTSAGNWSVLIRFYWATVTSNGSLYCVLAVCL